MRDPRPLDVDSLWAAMLDRAGKGGAIGPEDALGAEGLELHAEGTWSSALRLGAEVEALLDIYWPLCARVGDGLVIAQMGQSLDGRIATQSGHSHYVTGAADIRHLHRLRALVDAVVVGAGTVVADDPRLTVRLVGGDSPVRVVLDPNGRVPGNRQVFEDGAAPTLHLLRENVVAPARVGVEVLRLAPAAEGDMPGQVLALLRSRGLRRVLIEGGGVTVSHFLAAGCLDRLHVTVANLIIGSGRPAFSLPPIQHLDEALRPSCRRFDMGADLLFDLQLHPRGRPAS